MCEGRSSGMSKRSPVSQFEFVGGKTPLATAVGERVIRVFISSTFLDMKREREELVKRVFPRLKKICDERGVSFSTVDLRWGITEEQASRGRVLPICFREIDKCRPFFIGILGDRYGSPEDEIPGDLLEREKWLENFSDRSVTELEILYGFLNDPGSAECAYFYFRDPYYVKSVDPDFEYDRPERLADLKERIRSSGAKVRENYSDPDELGRLIHDDLIGLIDELFPKGSELDPLDRDALDHELYAYSKYKTYISRREYYDALDNHAESGGQPLVITGESGSGKSALMANWLIRYREANPNNLYISHFIGANPYSADWAAMLRRIIGELKRRYGIEGDIPADPKQLKSGFANWLYKASSSASKRNEKIIIILDGLNQLEERDGASDPDWLPPTIPENIRIFLSTLPGRMSDYLMKRELPVFEIRPLTDDEKKILIGQYLSVYGKSLDGSRIEKIASSKQTSNPLFLRSLLDELIVFGFHENLDRAIDYYLSSKTIPELFERILKRVERDYEIEWPGIAEDALRAIWASRRGLSEEELSDLLGVGDNPMPRSQLTELLAGIEAFLVRRAELLNFGHDYIRQAVLNRYLSSDDKRTNAHLKLADYFERERISQRSLDELPWHLAESGEWKRLHSLLGDPVFFGKAWDKDRFEIKRLWARVETSSDLKLADAYGDVLDNPEQADSPETVEKITVLLQDTGHTDMAVSLWEFLADRYRSIGNLAGVNRSLVNLGYIFFIKGESERAMALYREAADICREIGDTAGLSRSLGNQALILRDLGDLDGAMRLHREVEKIFREINDIAGLSRSLGNQGIILRDRGDLDGAMKLHKETERIFRELNDPVGLYRSINNQANILYIRGDRQNAMKLFQESEHICRDIGDRGGLQVSLGNQANILTDWGDFENAMKLHVEEERICREIKDPGSLSRSLFNQAKIYHHDKDPVRAMELLRETERICREIGNPIGIQYSAGYQAVILRESGDLAGAMELLKQQERICRNLGNSHILGTCLNNQALILRDLGDFEGALKMFAEDEKICRDLKLPLRLLENLRVQAEIYSAMGRREEAARIAEEAFELATKHGTDKLADEVKKLPDKHK